MSRMKTSIELTPPDFAIREEHLLSVPMTCGYCHGQGFFAQYFSPYGDEGTVVCPMCEGSGMVEAEVRIKWQPSNNNQ